MHNTHIIMHNMHTIHAYYPCIVILLVEYNIILLRVYVPTHVAQDLQSCNKRGPLRGLRKFFIAQVLAIVTYSMHTLGTRIVSSVARPGKADFHDLVLFPVRRMNLSCT